MAKEAFLHYIWQFQRFHAQGARTTDGRPVNVIRQGIPHQDSGPDFQNARVRIADTLWAGNVEIHTRSSEWDAHGHQHDPAFNTVILHVVGKHDREVFTHRGWSLPTLELGERIPPSLWRNYHRLMVSRKWVPCEGQLVSVRKLTWDHWLDRLLIERLQDKVKRIELLVTGAKGDQEEAFYRLLARHFGGKVNADPFERLATRTPLTFLARHRDRLFQLEAILFGQAGFLEGEFDEAYPTALQKEYLHLKRKGRLRGLDRSVWKFLRLRPANFPTVRLAQFAMLVHRETALFSRVMETSGTDALFDLFRPGTSHYWESHYVFGKTSSFCPKSLGRETARRLVINVVVPFLFFHGYREGKVYHREKALAFLEELRGENDRIIRKWKELGIPVGNAYRSQALLQLKQHHCSAKKCLTCPIGEQLLNRSGHGPEDI